MEKSYSTTYRDTLKPNLKTSGTKQPNVVKYSRESAKIFQHETQGTLQPNLILRIRKQHYVAQYSREYGKILQHDLP